jgi:hypothetical protein
MSKDIFKFTTSQYHHHPYHIQGISVTPQAWLSLLSFSQNATV